MLFSYMLHFFVVIGVISVLAIPLPEEGKQFDFNDETDGRQSLSSEGGKTLARGNWLRKAHPKNMVWIISNRIYTHLTYCSLVMMSNHRWISLFSSLYVISHAPLGHINRRFSLPGKFQVAIQNVLL